VEELPDVPRQLTATCWPNPFNPSTTIGFGMPTAGRVQLRIYDLRGRQVRTLLEDWRAAGWYEETWQGDDDRGQRVSSGIYLYVLQSNGQSVARKMALLK
jgi:hypothetical protein